MMALREGRVEADSNAKEAKSEQVCRHVFYDIYFLFGVFYLKLIQVSYVIL